VDIGSFYSIRQSKQRSWHVRECNSTRPFYYAKILPRRSESLGITRRVRKFDTNILPNLRQVHPASVMASWDGRSCATPERETIPSHTRSELLRYLERLRLLKKQIATIKQRCKETPSKTMPAVPMSRCNCSLKCAALRLGLFALSPSSLR